MRFLPHTWAGLHPAFPPNPDPSESSLSFKPAIMIMGPYPLPSYSFLALVCVAISAKPTMSMTRRRSVGVLAKATLVATTMGVANTIHGELAERHAASIFFRCRHIELPAFKVADRLTSWDADNWSILGGAAGLFAARRRACPLPSVSRPLWYLLHAMSGVYLAGFGHTVQKVATEGTSSISVAAIRERQLTSLQKASYQPEVAQEILLDALNSIGGSGVLKEVQVGRIKLSPDTVAALRDRTVSQTYGPAKYVDASQTAVQQALSSPNYSDAFHKTTKVLGSTEPVPYASRNYDWSYSLQRSGTIPELEGHIAELRKKRQQLSNEAEAVRNWLSEREADYYTRKLKASSDVEFSALKPEKFYLEKLGYWYLATWMAVSECDWMIAGATDHLAFAKATQQGLEWPPAQSGNVTTNVRLEHMLLTLPTRLKSLRASSAELPAQIAQLKKALNDASTNNDPRRTAIEADIRGYERLQERWFDEILTTERVWANAMKRSENGDERSKT